MGWFLPVVVIGVGATALILQFPDRAAQLLAWLEQSLARLFQ